MNQLVQTDRLPVENKNKKNPAVAAALTIIRTAHPAQARNFTKEEVILTNRLWAEVFKDVPGDDLIEATMEFVENNTNPFFPIPGQIMECVRKIRNRKYHDELMRLAMDYADKEAAEYAARKNNEA